mgnify:FL=1|tara:strand:+ start:187 stop:381 length:195 start_codon:yes stop_codon:yes gene_type:complete
MSLKKRKEFKYILLLNLIVGVHNIINFSINGYTTALIIGIINIGVWCFLRDMKLIPIIIRRLEK